VGRLITCADIAAFNTAIELLKERWDYLESMAFSDHRSHNPDFHSWFLQWKAKDFCHCTLHLLMSVWVHHQRLSYTNDNKSVNALLKKCLGHKMDQWALFNSKIKGMIKQQQQLRRVSYKSHFTINYILGDIKVK